MLNPNDMTEMLAILRDPDQASKFRSVLDKLAHSAHVDDGRMANGHPAQGVHLCPSERETLGLYLSILAVGIAVGGPLSFPSTGRN